VLLVSPHPDDETLGCAGTIARVKQLGGEVYCRVGTWGGIHQYTEDPVGPGADSPGLRWVSGSERRAEFEEVMRLLDVDGWDALLDDDAHMALDVVPQKQLVTALDRGGPLSLDALRPTLLLIPARSFNQDHDALFRACLAASRPQWQPSSRHVVPQVLAYDNGTAYWSDTPGAFTPSVFVDISDVLDLKVKAVALYSSQLRAVESAESACITQARAYGRRIGCVAAEAFHPLRLVL
jgi:LmbE family N-acetylglucosaminyl deacetylase